MKRHSIHIGVDRYEDKDICNLPHCTADAHLLSTFFQQVAGYESVSVLSNPGRTSIFDAVASEVSRLQPGDLFVLSYSGHGFDSDGRFSLCGTDARMPLLRAECDGVPLNVLRNLIRDVGCDGIFLLDACPSEGKGTRGIGFRPSKPAGRDLFVAADPAEGPSFAILHPEQAIEVTALGHGLFSASLDRALREAHAEGNAGLERVRELAENHMKAICRDSNVPCPGIVMMISGPSVNLW